MITGGNGFIGKHLKKYLEEKDYCVIAPSSKELNIMETENYKRYCMMNIQHVVHLAGKTFVPASWETPKDFFMVNTIGTMNLIEFCKENRINMTYISAYIYGYPKFNPVNETLEAKPNNPYAKSKYMAEELCEFYSSFFDMNISVLRLFNVFGPGQSEQFLIPCIIKQVLSGSDAIEIQDLEPKRDYVYIEDVCRAIELSIKNTQGYQVFNVGSGESYSVYRIIEMIQKEAGTDKKVLSQNNIRRNELSDVVADISAIRNKWGWGPVFSLKDGLRKCLQGED